MDNFEKRLKQDAHAIDAEVPAQLRSRINAQLASTVQQRPVPRQRQPAAWLSVATAAGVAVLGVLLLRGDDPPLEGVEPDATPAFAATPTYTPQQASPLLLQVQPVDVTQPLERELLSLQSDLQRVRASIEQELRSTL
jgi:hypothetical protein